MRGAWSHPLYYQADLNDWKRKCEDLQNRFCNDFGERVYQCNYNFQGKYSKEEKEDLKNLKTQLCLLLFGEPVKGKGVRAFSDYKSEQWTEATDLLEHFSKLNANKSSVKYNVVLVCWKSFDDEIQTHIFRIHLADGTFTFVDRSRKDYENWKYWLQNNGLPPLKCYPRDGRYPRENDATNQLHSVSIWLEFGKLPSITLTKKDVKKLSTAFLSFTKSQSGKNSRTNNELQFILDFKNSMENEPGSRSAFLRFLFDNHRTDSTLRLTNFLKKINKPDHLFNGLALAENITIDESREESLVVYITITKNIPTTLLVNRTLFQTNNKNVHHATSLRYDTLFRKYLKSEIEPILRDPNHVKYLHDLLEQIKPLEEKKLRNSLYATCRKEPSIIAAVIAVAHALEVKSIFDFCSVAEIVVIYEPSSGEDIKSEEFNPVKKIEYLMSSQSRKDDFIKRIQMDIENVKLVSENEGHVFETDICALYHFRKHCHREGSDFYVTDMTDKEKMTFYLKTLPDAFFTPAYLGYVTIETDRIVETYCGNLSVSVSTEKNIEYKKVYGKLMKQATSSRKHRAFIKTMHIEERHLLQYNNDFKSIFGIPSIETV